MVERLAAATSDGLAALPANFGDMGGDWVTVRSRNPFEVLYFDYRLADRITPDAVGHHRELLRAFWQEKLKSMSQGAARLAILKKYGGEHESERLVRSYPDLIERAYQRLSTINGIEETYREIVAEQQRAVFARIDEKLSDYLVDLVFQPQEMLALLEFADREGAARELVAAYVQDRIRTAGLVSDGVVSGATLEQQLLSSSWVHPSRRAPAQAVVPPQRAWRVLILPLFLAVFLVLAGGAAFFLTRRPPVAETKERDTGPPLRPAVPVTPETSEEVGAPPEPALVIPEHPSEPASQTTPPQVVEPPPQPAVSVEDRKAAQDELANIRSLGASDPTAALERALQLDRTLAAHPQELAGERAELANLRTEVQEAILEAKLAEESKRIQEESAMQADRERAKEWERRLSQIESLSKQGNYSGAKLLADQLLGEPGLPEPIAIRARKLADEAVEKLQAIFSRAKVKSKTARSPDPPN